MATAGASAGSDHDRQQAILSCTAYSAASVLMVLLNKMVMSNFEFPFNAIVLVSQSLLALALMAASKSLGILDYRPFSWELARTWLPVNIFFTLMLYTSFRSLQLVAVSMVTVFKNITNLGTVFGAWYLFNEGVSVLVIASLVLVVAGAVLSAWTDLDFNLEGYVWMVLNCFCTSAYVLYMRAAVQTRLSTWDKAYLNNVLSVPIGLFMALLAGEVTAASQSPMWGDSSFLTALLLSGITGFALNLASLWCVAATSATTYAMVGALNKIPVVLIGVFLFNNTMTWENGIFVTFGLMGGVVYAYAKAQDDTKPRPSTGTTSMLFAAVAPRSVIDVSAPHDETGSDINDPEGLRKL